MMDEHTFRVRHVDHVELFVPDQYAAAEWYRRVLGLEIVAGFEFWAVDGPLMISSDGGHTMLALFAGEPGSREGAIGFRRVAFRVDGPGFMQFLQRLPLPELLDNRDVPLSADQIVDHERSWSIYFHDPFGYLLEVTTYDHEYVKERLDRHAGE